MKFRLALCNKPAFPWMCLAFVLVYFLIKSVSIKNFCLSKALKEVWNSKETFNVTKSTRAESNLLTIMATSSDSKQTCHPHGIRLLSPGTCLPHRTRACCLELKFWYCAEFPTSVARRTLNHDRKRSQHLITINILDCATIMLPYNYVLGSISKLSTQHTPRPKSLTHVHNTTSCSWTRKITTSSLVVKFLTIFVAASLWEN